MWGVVEWDGNNGIFVISNTPPCVAYPTAFASGTLGFTDPVYVAVLPSNYGSGSNLTGITAAQVWADPAGTAAAATNGIDAAFIAAAGAITNLTVVQPYALTCSPTVSVTKAMINAAPWGEMSLSLTGVVQLFCIDTNSFAVGDVATWSTYFSGTNSITFCTNTITGTAWTNATATGSDRIFRKASGKATVAIW